MKKGLLDEIVNQAWYHMSINPVPVRMKQEDYGFDASLDYEILSEKLVENVALPHSYICELGTCYNNTCVGKHIKE